MNKPLKRLLMSAALMGGLSCCATNDNPPCRRVSAEQFMRPHTFKGIASAQFIGVSDQPAGVAGEKGRAFKQIWEMGLNHSWAVIWCPVSELPEGYLKTALEKPNRRMAGTSDFTHE